MSPFWKTSSSVSLHKCERLCNHYNQNTDLLQYPTPLSHLWLTSPHCPSPPSLWICFLFLSCLPILASYMWNHGKRGLLTWLLSLSVMHLRFLYVVISSIFFLNRTPLYGCTRVNFIDGHLDFYNFKHTEAYRFFCNHKICCVWLIPRSRIAVLYDKCKFNFIIVKLFSKVALSFCIFTNRLSEPMPALSMYKGVYVCVCVYACVCVYNFSHSNSCIVTFNNFNLQFPNN